MKTINMKVTENQPKTAALSPGKNDKYGYLTSKDILLSDQSRIMEQAKFTFSPFGKTFEKQTKTIEKHEEK